MEWSTWPYSQRNPFFWVSIFAFRRKHNLQTAWHVFCIPPPHHPLPSGKLQTASLEAEAEIIPRDSPLWINANILQYFHWKQFTRHLIIGHFAFCFKVWDSSGDHIPITSQCCAGTMERYESVPLPAQPKALVVVLLIWRTIIEGGTVPVKRGHGKTKTSIGW